eukprot:757448-Hanusia_phi.AAC.3
MSALKQIWVTMSMAIPCLSAQRVFAWRCCRGSRILSEPSGCPAILIFLMLDPSTSPDSSTCMELSRLPLAFGLSPAMRRHSSTSFSRASSSQPRNSSRSRRERAAR